MSKSLPLPLTPARPAPLVVALRAGQATPAAMGQAELDAAVRLAAQLCAAPMAFVAWTEGEGGTARGVPTLQAAAGITLPQLAREFDALRPLLGATDLVVIDGPAAPGAGPEADGFAFLAGAPLHVAGTGPVGALAVLDRSPRSLDPAQRAALGDLAAVLSSTLSAHHRAADLARHATVDLLTGVANRKQFDAVMLAELHHAMRSGEAFTLLLLSLDGVQDIRNGFGAAAGDAALREVCSRMARQVRLGDLLARLSGFEFGAVMRHGAADAAELLAQRIVDSVRQPIELESGDVVGLRVCIGIAAYDDSIDSVAALMSHAEQALLRARRQHEQRWNFFGRKFETPPSLRLVGGDVAGAEPSA
jgi:diguanylate cyclase (GGDEF)-like protein